MSTTGIPRSERLQRKVWETKDPGAKSKETKHYVIYFPEELKYSVVEGKLIEEINPGTKHRVHVKDADGTWEGIVYASGSKAFCKEQQCKLEELCSTLICNEGEETHENEDESDQVPVANISSSKRKATSKKDTHSLRKKARRVVDSASDNSEDETPDGGKELELLKKESERVNKLLLQSKERVNGFRGTEQPEVTKLEGLFVGLNRKLDTIIDILGRIAEHRVSPESKATSSHSCSTPTQPKLVGKVGHLTPSSSPPQSSAGHAQEITSVSDDIANDPDFVIGGVNLILDVSAKAKKPTLYATALMAHVFTDEEMREGAVEPKETNSKKKALDQNKINIIKRCIRIKFSDRVFERSWPEIRVSMNQKCLDKLKQYRKNYSS